MLSSHYHHHKSKTFSQLTQCPFTGTLLLLFLTQLKVVSLLKIHHVRLIFLENTSTCSTFYHIHAFIKYLYYPTALKGRQSIVFTHGVWMVGQALWGEKLCPGCISETIRYRKLILGRDIGWGVYVCNVMV